MGDWFKSLGLFFADMYRHTVGQMTGVLSIILALAPVLYPAFFAGDQGLLHSKWTWEVAAAISFFFAAHSAWSEQHKARLEIERKYFDERPLLGIETHSVEGPRTWSEYPVPVTFSIHHLSGRVATAIRFEPIPSLLGKYALQFDALAHVDSPAPKGLAWKILEPGTIPLSAHDLEKMSNLEKIMLAQFLDDSPPELIELNYRLIAHFKDGKEDRTQTFRLTFDKGRFRFLPNTAI